MPGGTSRRSTGVTPSREERCCPVPGRVSQRPLPKQRIDVQVDGLGAGACQLDDLVMADLGLAPDDDQPGHVIGIVGGRRPLNRRRRTHDARGGPVGEGRPSPPEPASSVDRPCPSAAATRVVRWPGVSASATTTRAPAATCSPSAVSTASGPARSVARPSGPVRRSAGRPAQRRHVAERSTAVHEQLPALYPAPHRREGRAEQRQWGIPGPHARQDLRPDVPAQRRVDLLEQVRRLGGAERPRRDGRPSDGEPTTEPPRVGVDSHDVIPLDSDARAPDRDRPQREQHPRG